MGQFRFVFLRLTHTTFLHSKSFTGCSGNPTRRVSEATGKAGQHHFSFSSNERAATDARWTRATRRAFPPPHAHVFRGEKFMTARTLGCRVNKTLILCQCLCAKNAVPSVAPACARPTTIAWSAMSPASRRNTFPAEGGAAAGTRHGSLGERQTGAVYPRSRKNGAVPWSHREFLQQRNQSPAGSRGNPGNPRLVESGGFARIEDRAEVPGVGDATGGIVPVNSRRIAGVVGEKAYPGYSASSDSAVDPTRTLPHRRPATWIGRAMSQSSSPVSRM